MVVFGQGGSGCLEDSAGKPIDGPPKMGREQGDTGRPKTAPEAIGEAKRAVGAIR